MNQSRQFFENDRIKSSRRYLLGEEDEEDFDQLKGLSHREDNHVNITEVEQDRYAAGQVN